MDIDLLDPKSNDSEFTPITHALMRLQRVTRILRIYGQFLAFLSIITIAGSITIAFFRIFRVLPIVYLTTLVSITLSAFFALLYSVIFESRRKEGDVLFKEISDELQWYIRYRRDNLSKKVSNAPEQRPDLDARLALRFYAQSSDLPLVPGAYGPLLYVLINIICVAFTAISLLPFLERY